MPGRPIPPHIAGLPPRPNAAPDMSPPPQGDWEPNQRRRDPPSPKQNGNSLNYG